MIHSFLNNLAYNYSSLEPSGLGMSNCGCTINRDGEGEYREIDVTYKTKIGENTTLFAAYIWQNDERDAYGMTPASDINNNIVRLWARYNF